MTNYDIHELSQQASDTYGDLCVVQSETTCVFLFNDLDIENKMNTASTKFDKIDVRGFRVYNENKLKVLKMNKKEENNEVTNS